MRSAVIGWVNGIDPINSPYFVYHLQHHRRNHIHVQWAQVHVSAFYIFARVRQRNTIYCSRPQSNPLSLSVMRWKWFRFMCLLSMHVSKSNINALSQLTASPPIDAESDSRDTLQSQTSWIFNSIMPHSAIDYKLIICNILICAGDKNIYVYSLPFRWWHRLVHRHL